MARHSPIRVDDDLATGEAAVGVRTAELEAPGRVHEHFEIVTGELRRQRRSNDVLHQRGLHLLVDVDVRRVLRGDQDRLEPDREAVAVFDRHLRLAVGSQEVEDAFLAHLREPARQAVGQPDRDRHEVVGVVARVTEHHSLVAGADFVVYVAGSDPLLVRLVDTHRDVGRLLVDRHDDPARLAVDAVGRVRVTDLADRVAREAGEVDVRLGADLARDDTQARGDQGLARDAAVRVFGEDRVEHAVADLVRHLVGMTFGHRLGREGVPTH